MAISRPQFEEEGAVGSDSGLGEMGTAGTMGGARETGTTRMVGLGGSVCWGGLSGRLTRPRPWGVENLGDQAAVGRDEAVEEASSLSEKEDEEDEETEEERSWGVVFVAGVLARSASGEKSGEEGRFRGMDMEEEAWWRELEAVDWDQRRRSLWLWVVAETEWWWRFLA